MPWVEQLVNPIEDNQRRHAIVGEPLPGFGERHVKKGPLDDQRSLDGKITPFNGGDYIQVNDLPASCKKAQELGGTMPGGFPFNLPDGTGAIAVVLDPAGHPVG